MKNLSTYVGAIFQQESLVAIERLLTEKSSWQEHGFHVYKEVVTYYFNNGVIVRRTLEQDNFPCQAACAECWITYEVPSNGISPFEILPSHKTFDSTCRESFWLKMHSA